MDALKSLIQPLVGGAGGSSVVDGMKLVVLGGTVETARRVSSSACFLFPPYEPAAHQSHRGHRTHIDPGQGDLYAHPSAQLGAHLLTFFLTAHFSEEDYPYDWLMLWLSRRPEWQRSREFETTTRTSGPGGSSNTSDDWDLEEEIYGENNNSWGDDERPKTRVVFQPTFDTTHTIYYKGHWLRVRRGRKQDGCEVLSISVVARSNSILKQLVLQAKREYEAEAVHRIQIYFADAHGSIVLNPGVKEMLLDDTRDFLKSEKWYADRGIPFRRGYLLHGVPGSGKSSLIHALAGELLLDIYVVSLSASWISDSTLTTLMGRVPARCVVLLEDLDAAFTRSVSRDNKEDKDGEKKDGEQGDAGANNGGVSSGLGRRRRRGDQLSDVNTLSLSGLLNALDGVAAAEGRLLFATTNHLERLDPALSRPGRMDVWIEFKNASKWQAEALFRNFFPSAEEEEEPIDETELEGINMNVEARQSGKKFVAVPPSPTTSTPSSGSLWSLASSATSLLSSRSGTPAPLTPASEVVCADPVDDDIKLDPKTQFGASNTAYLPPPPAASVIKNRHSAPPLDKKTLSVLAKRFADGVPEEEFSVAALQGYLLRHKAQPEAASNGSWIGLRRLKREKEAREVRERAAKEKRKKESAEREKEKKALEKKEAELEKVKQQLAEKEKEEELEKMRQQLKDKEREEKERKEKEKLDGVEAGEAGKAEGEESQPIPELVPADKEEGSVDGDDDESHSDEENIPPQSASSSSASSSWGEV
ncbi:hypothetical protein BDQ17DRAFT_1393236 [Cyathus striatus]|nr:hypothetical protein BDQ17DRAFT_1393236 [Cyathus striatus]